MNTVLIWFLTGFTLLATSVGAAYFCGMLRKRDEARESANQVKREKERADAKTREAEILTLPRGSKRDTIDRL